jgi:hypothetical protein
MAVPVAARFFRPPSCYSVTAKSGFYDQEKERIGIMYDYWDGK